MSDYHRPIAQTGPIRPAGAVALGGTQSWFTHVEYLTRDGSQGIVPARELPDSTLARFSAARAPIAGVPFTQPRIMGILNVTPDSFSDGGQHAGQDAALSAAHRLVAEGADIVDIGGESTRPGAAEVDMAAECARTVPVIEALSGHISTPISIDTRKSAVADAALHAGAQMVNDVSGLTFDPALAPLIAERNTPVCIMHSQGLPQDMQDNPSYGDVLLDVYDFLEGQITLLERAGLPRAKIIVDPGIGFGKTMVHNIALLQGLSLFHGLGCALLLGVSRKGFIGTLGGAPEAQTRAPGSIALALEACRQGVHIVRVHDVDAHRQALALWRAVTQGIQS